MTSTREACHRKLAHWLALLTIAALLLSGFSVSAAQAGPEAPKATTIIAALSDYGSGEATEQTVATMIAGWNPARIVTAGDNYHYQNCNTYATCVGNYYGSYVTAQTFMPTMGNHDYDNPPVGLTAWNNYFTWLPTTPDSQRRWYDFVVGDVHFFMLDGNGNQSTQSTWLSTAVPASTSAWNIAVLHQAPYSTGYYGDIVASQLPYGTYGIDFVISGHNHHFERLVKADGGKTVRYFIDGYGGSILSDSLGHSYCNRSTSSATSEFCLANTPGAMKITASDTSITFEYYNSAGVVQNTYTQVIGPEITTSVSSLSTFSTTPGTPSAAQTYIVAGSNLTADIDITAPAGFEIKTDSGAYGSGITLPQIAGVMNATTISVRLTGAEGTFSGNITHTSTGATTKNVAVSGTASNCTTASFQQGTAGYAGARDTHIQQANVTYNYGAVTPLMVDSDEPNSSGNDVSALLYWDLSTIPAGSTIESATVTVYVENVTESPGFDMYEMTQAWAEGTGNGSATGNGATWNTYDGSNAWPGGAGGASEKGSTALANSAATATGSSQAALNAAGEAMLEGWINTPANNKGLMIHAGSTTNGLDLTSKEGTTVANRPKLTISYCLAATTPYIITSGTLNAFSSSRNVPSVEQSYTVSGGNLTEDIVITAPADFQISMTSGGPFGSSISLTPDGSGTVAATPTYVQFLRSTLGTSTGNITHTSADATPRNVAVSGTAVNGEPSVTLLQPADDATGVSFPPTLQATVTDSDADTMNVSFYGRVAGEGTGEDLRFIVIPDTQNMSTSYPAVFNLMTQWIADNKTTQNIVFATSVGDIVNSAGSSTEWSRADTAYDILDAGSVSYSVGPGNHDLGGQYNTYFGPSRFAGKSYYQASYASGQNENNYSFFTAGGMDFIIINLQYNSTTTHQDWADALLKANPNKRGIVVQHNILNVDNSWQNQAPYTALKDNPNLFLMLCGHMHNPSDGSAYRAELGDDGHTIHILMTDYQDYPNGGNGYLRILRFSPADDKIYAQVYSPYVPAYLTSASNYEEFAMDYDLAGGAEFELIGTVNGVASGGNPSIAWPGRDPNTEYEWYAVANDGTTSTTSATWSFTTAALAVPKAPPVTSITQGSGNVTLAWDAVTQDVNNNEPFITEYRVYGSHDPFFLPTSSDLLGTPTPPTDTTFTHTGGSTGAINWYYLVRAVNTLGESANSVRTTGRFGFTLTPGTTTP